MWFWSLNGLTGFRLYFAKIGIGSPSKDFHVQVDTGSDLLWVNCDSCENCPTKSNLGVCAFTLFLLLFLFILHVSCSSRKQYLCLVIIILLQFKLSVYDTKSSSTSNKVTCDQEFCTSTLNGRLPSCKPNMLCNYNIAYGDGSTTSGYYVKDNIQLDKVTGNHQTTSTNGTVIFG